MKKSTFKNRNRFSFWLKACCILMLSGFSVTSNAQVTVTPGGNVYATLGLAFAAINAGTHTGAVTVAISANTTETGPCVLNSSGAGAASYTSLKIYPSVSGVSVSGPTTTGRGLIELNGADNVTIDGSLNGAGTTPVLTFNNTAANTVTFTSVIRIALSSLVTSADNDVVRNCILNGSAAGAVVSANTSATTGGIGSTHGILVSGGASTTTVTTAPSAISSNTTTIASGQTALNFIADNNQISACGKGIYFTGAATTVCPILTITNNTIGNPTAGSSTQVAWKGISVQGFSTGSVVRGNTIYMETFTITTPLAAAIEVGGVSATGADLVIEKNTIARAFQNNTGGRGICGINIVGGTNHIVKNNTMYKIINIGSASFSTTFGAFGVLLTGGTGHKIYHNSISITGSDAGTGNVMSCIAFTGTSTTGCDVRNNIFSNTVTSSSTTSSMVCVYFTTAPTLAMNLTMNNNAYYTGSNTTLNGIGQVTTTKSAANLFLTSNFVTSATTPSTNWRSITSVSVAANDNASYASTSAVPFTSSTNLHLDMTSGELVNVEQKGATGLGVANDIDGDVRPNAGTTFPDMGSDEVAVATCSSAAGGTITPSSISKCVGQTYTMASVGATTGTGITYQWEVSAIGGGVGFVSVSGGSGANTASYTTGALSPGTNYYRLKVTCSAGFTGTSNEVTLVTNANPTVSVSPNPANALICGSGSVVLTATGAATYTWNPTTALSPTSGSPVTASSTSSTSYTVTGTDINGCSATASQNVVVGPTLTLSSITATPPCYGSNSQINAVVTSSLPANYTVASITPTAIVPTGTPTVLSNAGIATPAPTAGTTTNPLDDGYWDNITLPFNFSFYGISYSTVRIATNGNVQFGAVVSTGGNPGNSSWTSQTIPTAGGNLDNFIAGPWIDHDLSTTPFGTLRYFTEGVSPNRKFVVSYENVHVFNSSDNNTSQIILNENGTVDVLLLGNGLVSTATKAMGVEGPGGLLGTPAPGRNSGTWTTAADEGWRFTPPSLNYSWSPAGALTNASISNPIAQNVTGSTTYTVTASDPISNCSVTGTVVVSATALSCQGLSTTSPKCAGINFNATASALGGGTPYSYTWSDGVGGSYANLATVPVNLPAGTYTLTCTISDACGAQCSSNITVVVNSNPNVTLTSSSAVNCIPGSGVILTATGAINYAYNPNSSLVPSSGSPVVASPVTATTYTVIGTDLQGCTNTASVTVNVGATVTMNSVTASPNTFCHVGATSLTANASMPPSVYCAAGATTIGCNTGDEVISNVTFGSINNSSTCAASGQYQDFTSLNASVTAGSTYSISVTNLNNFTGDQVTVWVDWNQNGSFLDANETYTLVYSLTTIGSIAVPVGAYNGTTRMRIRLNFTGAMSPCGTTSFGEVEDYSVTVSGGVNQLTYAWSQSGTSTMGGSTTANESVTNITATTTYSVIATSLAGCSANGSISVTNLASSSTINVNANGCYTWSVSGMTYTTSGTYIGTIVNGNAAGCDSVITMNLNITPGVNIAVKAILSGAYDASTGMMYDSLRVNGMIPPTEPYTGAPYLKPVMGGPAGETVPPSVLSVSGNNAIVDWVFLELRSSFAPSTILATKRALIQRDGDIVSSDDGMSPVFIAGFPSGNYYVSLKHRNHLGVMTASSVAIGPCANGVIDFTTIAVWVKPGEVNGPRKIIGGIPTLWSADANNNKNAKYNGLSNDKQEVLNAVGVATPNNILSPVYRTEDLNMDAKIKYNGGDNDRNVIANTVGVSTPNNIVNQHTPN